MLADEQQDAIDVACGVEPERPAWKASSPSRARARVVGLAEADRSSEKDTYA